eukprot:CAMPEP_0194324432 /NCGR_PEP_ID=MMETSP0171-20130528/27908_1 /TAXON_ID=218684 /ORGANISM="Corethron pennatum, Strain L29A3" /LENGTH=196 /DNA_ID=CAMNT_0039083333 /DNA_START=142 /DNA_END=732 /DNA_ORIENTATION=+
MMGTVSRFSLAAAALMGVVGAFTCPSSADVRASTLARTSRSTFLPVTMQPGLEDMLAEDDEEPEEYLLSAEELDAPDSVAEQTPSPSFLHATALAATRTTWQRAATDSGSPEYQIAGMTERITYLTQHLRVNPKDFSTRRGLLALVNKRRRLLNYLFDQDQPKYVEIVGALGIRHKAPSRVQSKEEKYGQFQSRKK